MNKEIDKKLNAIKQYFKKDKNLLELTLYDYESYSLYIRIDKLKSTKTYKLSWFDLSLTDTKHIDKYISTEYIPEDKINIFIDNMHNLKDIDYTYVEENLAEKGIVILDVNVEDMEKVHVMFNTYIPESVVYVYSILLFIFQNLPSKLDCFFNQMISSLTHQTTKYEYKKEFSFDLFNDDIDEIFAPKIIERGEEYYYNDSVLFLEKIDDRYFAVVEGTQDYLVIVRYNEEEKKLQLYCNCPCEFFCKHMYAVLLAIRNENYIRFYKISHKNNTKNLIEKVFSYDYFLCTGIVEDKLEIVNNQGELELVSVLDENNKPIWTVIEDDEDESLTHAIEEIIESNK